MQSKLGGVLSDQRAGLECYAQFCFPDIFPKWMMEGNVFSLNFARKMCAVCVHVFVELELPKCYTAMENSWLN